MTARSMGVEEEMFLIDPRTRRLAAVSNRVISSSRARESDDDLEQELFLQQIETKTDPQTDLDDLHADLRDQRRLASEAAGSAGVTIAAVATPVLADAEAEITPKDRYRSMMSEFAEVGRRAVVCATHVHIEVDDADAVGVIDDLRPWLPLLLAVSANSPFDHGIDTGYASWRAQAWDGWPSAGPVEAFGDDAGYRAAVAALIASGAALDEGMVYFDVRVAQDFPTVEIRVADVCTDLGDTVLVAELARALVETVARARHRGVRPEPWRVDLLRAARWQARRGGLTGSLMDPVTKELQPAADVLAGLQHHLQPVLAEHGTADRVSEGLGRLLHSGTGSQRQRATASRESGLEAVVDDILARTRASFDR